MNKKLQRIVNRNNAKIGAIRQKYKSEVEQIFEDRGVCSKCGQRLPEK